MRDYLIDTEVGGRPPESPLQYARQLAVAELRQRTTPAELAWLHAEPVLWLRALTRIIDDTNGHNEQDRLRLRVQRTADLVEAARHGIDNPHPSKAYRQLEAEYAKRLTTRANFLLRVKRRRDEVESLCGYSHRTPMIGDLVGVLVEIVEMTRSGSVDNIRDKALYWAHRVAAEYADPVIFDNSAADPVKLTVAGLAPATKLNCRICHQGKVDPREPAPQSCPRCHQRHEIEIEKGP